MKANKLPLISRMMPAVLAGLLLSVPAWAEEPSAAEAGDAARSAVDDASADPAAGVDAPPAAAPAAGEDLFAHDTLLRKSNRRAVPAPNGETGLIRIHSADSSQEGKVHLGIHGQVFHSENFLDDSKVSESVRGQPNTLVGGDFTLGYTPLSFMEVWMRYRNYANDNPAGTPNPKQVQGDFYFGTKLFYPVLDAWSLGGEMELSFLNGVGDISLDPDGTSVRLGLLSTVDFREIERKALVRFHVNTGFNIGKTNNLSDQNLNELEEFELNLHGYHRYYFGFGLESTLPYLQPFFEYSFEIPFPVGDDDLEFSRNELGRNLPREVPYNELFTHRITPGLRITAIPDLTITTAVEIGVSPTLLSGVPAVPDWLLHFGLTYSFDPLSTGAPAAPPKEIIKTVEKRIEVPPPPSTGKLIGKVVNKDTGDPVGGVLISFVYDEEEAAADDDDEMDEDAGGGAGDEGGLDLIPLAPPKSKAKKKSKKKEPEPQLIPLGGDKKKAKKGKKKKKKSKATKGKKKKKKKRAKKKKRKKKGPKVIEGEITDRKSPMPPVASDPDDGRYVSYELPPGEVIVVARREGFRAQQIPLEVMVGDTRRLDIELTPEILAATITGTITDTRGDGIKATVWVRGKESTTVETEDDGTFKVQVPFGKYSISAVGAKRLARGKELDAKKKPGKYQVSLKLRTEPAAMQARVEGDEIKVTEKIGFVGSDIDPTASGLIDQVAHIMLTRPELGTVRIEGHTANDGTPELTMQVSQARAEAAMRMLVKRGVPKDRLRAQGFGSLKPRAPNFTKRGKEQNRRIEFRILGAAPGS